MLWNIRKEGTKNGSLEKLVGKLLSQYPVSQDC